jgi:choline-sulfatase
MNTHAPVHHGRVKGERRPSRWTRSLLHGAAIGAQFGVGAAVGLWAGDVVTLALTRGHVTISQWLQGVGASLWVCVTTGIVLGGLLGPAMVYVASSMIDVLRPKWAALRAGDPAARQRFAAAVLTLVTSVGLLSWVGYRANIAAGLEFARPDTIAGAVTGFQWVLVAMFVVAWVAGNRAALSVVKGASRAPGLRWVLSHTWSIVAAFAGVAAVGALTLLHVYDLELAALQWRNLIALSGLVLGVAFVAVRPTAIAARRGPLAWSLLAVGLVATAAGGVAAFRLRPESTKVRKIAFERSLGGRLGYAAWTAVFDFDGDGQLSILGGGDCAPFDPRRYAGAVEIPGNGVDEDCDGTDVRIDPMRFRPRPQLSATPISIRPRAYEKLPQRPTIVLVTIDALGAPRLTALGGSVSLMPNLDDFANRSVLFTHCFSQGPSTRLSFPSMFTSRWDSQLAFEAGVRLPHSFGPSERQIQDVLDDAGYETVAVIPNEYFGPARWPSVTRGFQHVDTSALGFGKHDAPQVTDAALRWLSADRERPLYLWLHYYDAHPPYLQLPGVSYSGYEEQPRYEAELTYIDRELGRLLSALEQRPDPTYVIVTSDHSTVFHPNPGLRRAHYGYDLYSATLHVPLIVHGPELQPRRVETLVSTMDIAPTVADLLRVNDRAEFEGTSMVPELLGGPGQASRAIFHELYLPERLFHGFEPLEIVSVHKDRYNLVLNRAHGIYELYDWTADYFEQNDLYEERADTHEVRELKSLLASFLQQAGTGHVVVAAASPGDRLERWRAAEP